jgi:hypothetical protein
MSTQIEIINAYNKQVQHINNALMQGDNNSAILLVEKLATYLRVKTKELGEGEKKEDVNENIL